MHALTYMGWDGMLKEQRRLGFPLHINQMACIPITLKNLHTFNHKDHFISKLMCC